MRTKFDRYAHRYEEAIRTSIGFVGRDVDFFTRAKAWHLVELAERELGEVSRLSALDVGCGVGVTDRLLAPRFGSLQGLDVSEEALEVAARDNPSVRYASYDGESFPFADGAFDVVFAICVLHHVLPSSRPALVAEMARITKHPGVVAVFEHNPYHPHTRLVVRRCEFDEDAVLLPKRETRALLGGSTLSVAHEGYILFVPWDGVRIRRFERRLQRVPLGAQYLVAGRR
jgi:SAM-dependent methyltransferase